jgi:hypothetical protein
MGELIDPDEYVTPAAYARQTDEYTALTCSEALVREWCRTGLIPAVKMGARFYVNPDEANHALRRAVILEYRLLCEREGFEAPTDGPQP